ncbi:MAG: type III-B CRISPR module RAMP protein Cmr4 [Saprospiraceae bacterium]|nr:type III-B CRISPR module RAMP protein Cmr4 [Saprospiraceae bacterium]
MTTSLYTITAMSNLHPGSGDANYGIIDKLVQRDPITGLPVVHASSLKGAILQHFFYQTGMSNEYIDEVFGGQTSKNKRINEEAPNVNGKRGEFVFLEAQLLSLPVRCNSDVTPFFRVTSPGILTELRQQMINTGLLAKEDVLAKALQTIVQKVKTKPLALQSVNQKDLRLEDQKFGEIEVIDPKTSGLDKVAKLLGDYAIVVPDKTLEQLSDNHHLPVIARNHLENGQSTNLWYEQVLPRQTRLWFAVMNPEILKEATDFKDRLCTKGMVQIGANASVGYGYCTVESFKVKP